MGLDRELGRKRGDEPENPERRRLLIGGAAVAAGAVLGAGIARIADSQNEQLLTHKGKAIVLDKLGRKDVPPTASEITDDMTTELMFGGVLPAIVEAGRLAAGKQPANQWPKESLLVKIDGREPKAISVSPSVYQRIEQGDELPIEYVTSEDGREITKIKSLEPVR
jgi:hypothetical protein